MLSICKAGKIFSYDEKEAMSQFILDIFQKTQNGTLKIETTGTEKYTRRNLTEDLVKIF